MFLKEPKIELTRSPEWEPSLLKNQRKYQKSGSRKEILAVGRARGPKTRALSPGIAADPEGSLQICGKVVGPRVTPSRTFLRL